MQAVGFDLERGIHGSKAKHMDPAVYNAIKAEEAKLEAEKDGLKTQKEALENEVDMQAAKGRIRLILHDLRATLREIGMEDVLIRDRRQLAIRRDKLDCDYYRMLEGDAEAVNAFRGEYMVEYSWAELTTGKLHFRN